MRGFRKPVWFLQHLDLLECERTFSLHFRRLVFGLVCWFGLVARAHRCLWLLVGACSRPLLVCAGCALGVAEALDGLSLGPEVSWARGGLQRVRFAFVLSGYGWSFFSFLEQCIGCVAGVFVRRLLVDLGVVYICVLSHWGLGLPSSSAGILGRVTCRGWSWYGHAALVGRAVCVLFAGSFASRSHSFFGASQCGHLLARFCEDRAAVPSSLCSTRSSFGLCFMLWHRFTLFRADSFDSR